MTSKNQTKNNNSRALRAILGVTASLLVYGQIADADARRQLIPDRPSIEVNLEVLEFLRGDALPPPPAPTSGMMRKTGVPFQQKPRVSAGTQSRSLQNQPLATQQAPTAQSRTQPRLPAPPAKPYATYQPHPGWGDRGAEPVKTTPKPKPKIYTHAPATPTKVVNQPKPVAVAKPVVTAPVPTPASAPVQPAPDPFAPTTAPAIAPPSLPEPDMASIQFEDFPTLEPIPDVPEPISAPAPVPSPTLAPAPVVAPAPLPPMDELPIASLPDPTPMPPAKPRMVNRPSVAPEPVPSNVTLPSMPELPDTPLLDAPPAPLPTPPSDSAMPSLSKGLDDFMTKEQPPLPPPSGLPDLGPITGSNQIAAPMPAVSEPLPSLSPITGETDMPELPLMPSPQPVVAPVPEPIAPAPLPDAPALPPMAGIDGLPELPAIDGLPPLDGIAPPPAALPPTAAPEPIAPIEAMPVEQQMAALPPTDAPTTMAAPQAAAGTKALTINFAATETEVPVSEQAKLSQLAQEMIASDQAVRIEAFAGGSPEQANVARRVSLSRALAIRAYLIDKGVKNLKINVQPLGNKVTGDPERADIIYQ